MTLNFSIVDIQNNSIALLYRAKGKKMYAHSVIELMEYNISILMDEYREKFGQEFKAECSYELIKTAQNYHFGNISDIENIVKTKDLFTGEYGEDVKLPYPSCWFDYHTQTGKGAFLACEITKNLLFLDLYVFKNQSWMPNPYQIYVGFGDDVKSKVYEDNQGSFDTIKIRELSPNVFVTFSGDQSGDISYNTVETVEPIDDLPELKEHLIYFNMCLLLLSCKNIKTETNAAPAKLNKKRESKGKQPLLDYETLTLILPKKKGATGSGSGHTSTKRLHMASGHFKTYTKEKPLFGKVVGRFWIPAHMRGDKNGGEIIKKEIIIKTK